MGPHRYPELDGIRGLAIVIVFIFHFGGGAQSPNHLVRAVGLLIHLGWSGVTLFFVLSGFLISGIIWDGREKRGWWKSFYKRRTLRIFPLYYLALFLIFLVAVAYGNALHCLKNLWVNALYLQNVPQLMGRAQDTGSTLWTSHFWSLAVEEQFYVIWPLLLSRMSNINSAMKLCISVFVFSFLYRFYLPSIERSALGLATSIFIPRTGELALGSFLAMCFRRPDFWAKLQECARPAALVSLAGFFLIGWLDKSLHAGIRTMDVYGLVFISIFFGMVIVMALSGGTTSKIMRYPFLRRMGTISYGFYVFHVLLTPVIQWLTDLTMKLMPRAGENVFHLTSIVVGFTVSYVTASLSYRYYESYFLRLRGRVAVEAPAVALVS